MDVDHRSSHRGWLIPRRSWYATGSADVAQLVEHHLAKVRVASSNLVVRSSSFLPGGQSLRRR